MGKMNSDVGPVVKDLVLIGGGHSHVYVLKMLGMNKIPGVRVTLVAKEVNTPYSGMLPGHVAGHYTWDECHVDLRPLCTFAGHRLIHDEAVGIDTVNKRVMLKNRPPVSYDALSVDIGITPAAGVRGAADFTTPVKPIFGFGARWESLMARVLETKKKTHVVVVGGGAGGVELALAMQHRLRSELEKLDQPGDRVEFALVTRGELMPTHPAATRKTFRGIFEARGVELVEHDGVENVTATAVQLASGRKIPADECIWCTQAAPQAWPGDSGLDTDDGFIRVSPSLQSTNVPGVFAAGDVASVVGHPRPKAGVFAVRQGPPLAGNLRRYLLGESLVDFTPQKTFLGLISTGSKHAIASWGSFSLGGATSTGTALWAWKDRIDRKWMKMYQEMPEMPAPEPEVAEVALNAGAATIAALRAVPMRCGGCGAKVGASVLSRVMARLTIPTRPEVDVGLDQPDDAAVITVPPGKVAVHTVDFFRSFVDDPYIFGQVAVVHALGDCWAMGAEPHAVLAVAQVPYGLENQVEEELYQMMAGATSVLSEVGCALAGGHSCEGSELALGFAVHGVAERKKLMKKGGMKSGQVLILTKPIGTGTLFAADMRAKAEGRWVSAALDSMRKPSAAGAEILVKHGATSCTDVTGFGLLGHLVEMCKGSSLAAVLDLDALPILDGAEECLKLGITSSLQPANVRLSRAVANQEEISGNPRYPLIYDPQTAGGLLAAVDKDKAKACVAALREAGYPTTCVIGETFAHLPAVASAPEQVVYVQDAAHRFASTGEGDSLVQPVTVENCDTGACDLPSKFTST
jgi:selenide,water dikinase